MGCASYVLLEGVSWDTYQRLADEVGERPIKFTYCRGSLEITTAEFEHETYKSLLSSLVSMLTLVLDIPICSGGSTTMRLKSKRVAMEPDACFWIFHERHMRGKREFSLDADPPPDLVLEINDPRTVINRLPMLAAMGVPEVWHWREDRLIARHFGSNGRYREAKLSLAFPFLAMSEVQRFMAMDDTDQGTISRRFMAWVEKEIKPRMNGRRKNGKRAR